MNRYDDTPLVDYLRPAIDRVGADNTLIVHPPACLETAARLCPEARRYVLAADDDSRGKPEIPASALAVVLDAPACLGLPATRRLLARLRDVSASRVIAAFCKQAGRQDNHRPWQAADFLALGFRRAADSASAAPNHLIYRYDISDYKTTPDWLSPKYWANPRRWDQDRW